MKKGNLPIKLNQNTDSKIDSSPDEPVPLLSYTLILLKDTTSHY